MVSSGGGRGAAVEGLKGPLGVMSQSLKKGPWTAAEDGILMEYVKKHGEGNWNAVQKNSGLMRCGKSCRLRWANHLRPNLKKGSFSSDEERIIIELHAKLGNKWARMAAQLPGRTDNEIKNYWNTRMKRRQRAGLPIYPQEVQEKAAVFHLQQQVHNPHHHHHHQKRHHNSSSSPSLSSLLTSSQNIATTYNPSLSLFNNFNFSSPQNHHPFHQNQANSYYANNNSNRQFKLFCNTNNMNSTGFSGSPYNHQPLSAAGLLFNQNIQTVQPNNIPFVPNFKFESENFDHDHERDVSFSSMIAGASIDPIDHFVSRHEATELPSSQTPPRPTTPSSGSSGGGGVCVMVGNNTTTSNDIDVDYKNGEPTKTASSISNSGLLDALVQESHHLSRNDQKLIYSENNLSSAVEDVAAEKGKGVVSSEEEGGVELMVKNEGDANADNQWEDLSSNSQSSIGMKRSEEPLEEMNSMDDDLMSLLNNFPTSMPLPDWYQGGSNNISNASSSSITAGGSNEETADHQQNVPPTPSPPGVASPEAHWSQLGSYSWNNMPRIC
ncbi:hypothetical protein Dsin_031664 [Dipteronia sinensis]|uniref:MYB transcription factor n=1 Tax=Dipteronia sinensis TaxID=43782 RepID=A0AAD9ZMC2_9ROSI|nr:hypothetical protein Dsin_031664 [Dipteronia sinensis]